MIRITTKICWVLLCPCATFLLNFVKINRVAYILAYKLKSLGQILALKTRGRLICGSAFAQHLSQGGLCKLMADSPVKWPAGGLH